ncbi:maternal effect embryo arrest 9 [Perilla frutescens var. frutescens]|nr:maternal effect embryo arrest 9 [Perilla frutescens var. frutescens]
MEALFSEFTLLSDHALRDKSFDPSTIEDLMKLFEVEAYKAWADLELDNQNEAQMADNSMTETEDYLDSVMESAMEEFHLFEEEMNAACKMELDGLLSLAGAARKMGNTLEKAATFASNKYIEAAVNSATASMKSAVRSISSSSKKVHPS